MNQRTSTTRHRMIRAAWMTVAVTSGFIQLMLIICGGLFLSEWSDWKWISVAAVFLGFWSLAWPIYVHIGMYHSDKELLQKSRQDAGQKTEKVDDHRQT